MLLVFETWRSKQESPGCRGPVTRCAARAREPRALDMAGRLLCRYESSSRAVRSLVLS